MTSTCFLLNKIQRNKQIEQYRIQQYRSRYSKILKILKMLPSEIWNMLWNLSKISQIILKNYFTKFLTRITYASVLNLAFSWSYNLIILETCLMIWFLKYISGYIYQYISTQGPRSWILGSRYWVPDPVSGTLNLRSLILSSGS